MSDFPVTADVPVYDPSAPYMERILPWGEICRSAESKLKKLGLREVWRQKSASIHKTGRSWHDSFYEAMVVFRQVLEDPSESAELTADDKAFVEKAREGLMLDLPKRAGVEKELDWISANLHRNYPNVQDAPSLGVINCIIDLRLDSKMRASWWSTCWSKRLSPGDKKVKRAGLKEDVEAESEQDGAAHDSELMKRMFGGAA